MRQLKKHNPKEETMTVRELREHLAKYDENALIAATWEGVIVGIAALKFTSRQDDYLLEPVILIDVDTP